MSALFCGCLGKKENEASEDYLLPGGAWDPSVSQSPSTRSRNSTRSTVSSTGSSRQRHSNTSLSSLRSLLTGGGWRSRWTRQNSHNELDPDRGDYQPPPLVPSRTLPTIEEFKLLRTVGKGAFGKVMMAVHEETRILYAMKVVPKAKIVTKKQVEHILSESDILQRIRHPFCITLQYAFQNDDFLFYVFEFAAGGMLFYHLGKEGRFSEPRARFYFGEIALALDYLHSFGIIFRDLKPENCMLSEIGHVVLTDFGSAKMLEVSQKTSTIAGTPQYIAPEVLRGEPYSFSADWWSIGVLLYEMLTGKIPFNSSNRVELYKLVLQGEFSVPRGVSPRAKSLLYRLLNKDQDERLGCSCGSCQFHSAANIKQHDFFSKSKMDEEEEEKYAMEEAEREWEKSASSRYRTKSRTSSFLDTAGGFIRTMSMTASKRMSSMMVNYNGEPCEWTWEELEARQISPPFKPTLTSPTDLRHFDPTLTCIPPTLSDLVTTDRSLHVDKFDYIAPDEAISKTSFQKNQKSDSDKRKSETVSSIVLDNSTDEEKAMKAPIATIATTEGFVEGGLEKSVAPAFLSTKVVTVDVHAST